MDFEKRLEEIINKIKSYYPEFSSQQEVKIRKAYAFAEKKHRKQKRFSGDPYISHPIAVTETLLSIKPDLETVIASILHDTIDEANVDPQEIEDEFGPKIRFLCEGIEKVAQVQLKKHDQKYENIRKFFLALAEDVRVIFIRLADRIHNLATLEYVPPEKRKRIARESLEIYAPVAARLGLFEFKTLIEDYAFEHLHTKEYESISQEIIESRGEQKEIVEKAKSTIKKMLESEGIHYIEVQGRPKNLYSIFSKMKRKKLNKVSDVYDLYAVRILLRDVTDCYRVLGHLHSQWSPIPKRFKDYIALPKQNGYQSLHTTILGFGKIPIEVQIKTLEMHQDAEFGPASHWAYKKARTSNFDAQYISKMDWLPEEININAQDSPEEFYERVSKSILEERIYVFTPKGELINLPNGSTPVDFAFAIHSEIGESCIGSKVNGIIKPLDYKLKRGDVIEIKTQKGRKINTDWIKFVKSSRAITRIKNFINQEKEKFIKGSVKVQNQEPKLRLKKKSIFHRLGNIFAEKKEREVIIGGERNIPFQKASCCNPKPGNSIVAYQTRGLKVSIHKHNCAQLKNLEPTRMLEAHFLTIKTFELMADDRVGLFHDLIHIVSDCGINIVKSSVQFDRKTGLTRWLCTVECTSDRDCEALAEQLLKVPEVQSLKKV